LDRRTLAEVTHSQRNALVDAALHTHNERVDLAVERAPGPFEEEARIWRVSPRTALALFALPFSGVLLVGIDAIRGDVVSRLLAEDSVVEWGAALAIVAAAVLAAMVSRTLWRSGLRVQGAAYALFSVAAVLAAGEEISWGQRLLGLDTPESVREANLQGELTLHNLDAVYGPYVAAVLLVGLYGSVGPWFVYRRRHWRSPNWYLVMPPVFLSGAFLQLTAYRLFRYTGVSGHNYGEWCELCVAVAIAVFIALNLERLRRNSPPRSG
jgi:hypothetical protein